MSRVKSSIWRGRLKWLIVLFIGVYACIEPIDFEVPPPQSQIVVEGLIHDNPGPYTLLISRGFGLDEESPIRIPVEGANVTLFDDENNTEDFVESSPGEYRTSGIMQGQVGHAYYIRIETAEGQIIESEPDLINPVGEIKEIKFEYEQRTVEKSYGEIRADVFNIFIDAHAGAGNDNHVRWRFKGSYEVITWPSLHYTHTPPYTPYKDPFPCSGYILVPGPPGSGGLLEKVGECDCCICWVTQFEYAPQLSDAQFIEDNQFRNIKVGEVPINNAAFHLKYLIQVEQMSLTRKAFEFFKLVREQKEGASSLFQSPPGEIIGNMKALNSEQPVIGIFWATSISEKTLYLHPSDVPYPLTPIDFITLPCQDFYNNSSTTKPDNWE
jgi:hypothetical protein